MLDNIAFVINEDSNGETEYLTRNQYRRIICDALYAREVLGNKAGHRTRWEKDAELDTTWKLTRQGYGNGVWDTFEVFCTPHCAGYRERSIIHDAYRMEHFTDGGHELFKWWAVIDDEVVTCVYDFNQRTFVG